MTFKPLWSLGLMSGTALDGIDVALIRTDGERITDFGAARTYPYDATLRAALREALGRRDPDPELVRGLTDRHGEVARDLLESHPEFEVSVVGFHGHTIAHAPSEGWTLQIGDGRRLAEALGLDIVCDFRSADVAAGGQGAPLAPLYHQALCAGMEGPVAVLNIGGIANVTWIGPDAPPLAFDTGPGNALLDDWVLKTLGEQLDRDGQFSGAGEVDRRRVTALLGHPYFGERPPKSLDRLDFGLAELDGLSALDGAASLVELTCEAVAVSREFMPSPPLRWLVTGGGRRNPTLMRRLSDLLDVPVVPVEETGWDGDALEAQAFAFLAVRSLRGLPLSLPSTTGVAAPTRGGTLYRFDMNLSRVVTPGP